ncbi:MAG: hypothetical protein ACRDYV_12630, partial [Acidimicrobiia bacterium]
IVVRRGAGDEARVAVRSVCPRLLGTADVNSDSRHEIWLEDGPGNTAQDFNIVSWVGSGLRAAVASDVDNPLVIGWGMSGGSTLWCADADGDGRTDIIQNSFHRTATGEEVNEQEVVLRLDGGQLLEVYRGPPRTPLPGTASALVCGAVRS